LIWIIGIIIDLTLHIIKKAIMSCFWKYGEDPKLLEIKLNIYYLVTFFVLETGWYIYGSVLIFDESLHFIRKSDDSHSAALFYAALAIVVCTYIYFLYLLGICFLFCGAYMTFRDYEKGDEE